MFMLFNRLAVVLFCLVLLSTSAITTNGQEAIWNADAAPVRANGIADAATQNSAGSTGGVVLLANQNVLLGNATEAGSEIVIQRDDGSELRLDRQRVLCWGRSMKDLYRFRTKHRQSGDLNAIVSDITWCLRHSEMDEALLTFASEDIQAARRVAPQETELARLALQLHRKRAMNLAPQTSWPKVSMEQRDAEAERIRLVDHQQDVVAAQQDFDRFTLSGFARDIQPILLNRCGTCHRESSEQQWKLVLPAKGSRASARITRENLAATAKFINFEHGLESELRLRAMDGHAGERNSIGIRDNSAAAALDRWLQWAKPAGDPLDIVKRKLTDEIAVDEPADASIGDAESETAWQGASPKKRSSGIERLPRVANPFDPEIFNRHQQLR